MRIKTGSAISTHLLQYVILLFTSFLVLLPIYLVFTASFKSAAEFTISSVFALPKNIFYYDNFKEAFNVGNMATAFGNIGYIICIAMLINVIIGTMVAYALGRFNFKLKGVVLGAYSLSLIIPSITTQVATYTLVKHLHLVNTHYAFILLAVSTDVIQIYLYLQFIKNIPKELDESAFLEGASLFYIYAKIIFPLLAPATATVIIVKAIGIYNDFFIPTLYMPARKLMVISTSLSQFYSSTTVQWNLLTAGIVIVIIPLLLLYLFLQKYIFAGLVGGAVK